MRWRILSTASRSTPHREATCDNLLRGDHYREQGHKYPRKEKGQLTCTVTMASPVSKTNVLEKTLTTRPARKPTVNKCQTSHNLPSITGLIGLGPRVTRDECVACIPARLPPESCLISSGSSHSSDSATDRLVAAELGREAGRASRRTGWCWCWRWARKRPVERPMVRGAAVRRRARRQRVAVAIFSCWVVWYYLLSSNMRQIEARETMGMDQLASDNSSPLWVGVKQSFGRSVVEVEMSSGSRGVT